MKGLDAHLHPPEPEEFCLICLLDEDSCLCPECPVCQSIGDPACYVEEDRHFLFETVNVKGSHGLILTAAQKISARRVEQQLKAEAEAEAEFFEELGSWIEEVESIPVRPACSSFAGKG